MTDFDYVLTTAHDINWLTSILSQPFNWTMQTTFWSGALVEKSTSRLGLIRIRIQTWDKDNRSKLLKHFSNAATDLAKGEINTQIQYIDQQGMYIGWVLYHSICET